MRHGLRAFRLTGVAVVALIVVAGCTTKELTTTDTTSPPTTSRESSTTTTSGRGTTSTAGGGGTTTASSATSPWSRNAVEYRGEEGRRVTVECTPNGVVGSLWGTDPYTDDSSICTAGVHAGSITVVEGGSVEIIIAPGQEEYEGSTENGVTSRPYGPWDGSFRIDE